MPQITANVPKGEDVENKQRDLSESRVPLLYEEQQADDANPAGEREIQHDEDHY